MNSSSTPLPRLKWRNNRLVNISMFSIIAYAASIGALGLALPFFAHKHLPSWLGEQLGREVHIADIAIDPFELSLTLSEIKIKEVDTKSDFFSLHSLRADLAFWDSIKHGDIRLTSVQIKRPMVNFARHLEPDSKAETFNISDILQRLKQQAALNTAPVDQDNHAPAINFAIKILSLTEGNLSFNDTTTGLALNYADISFQLENVDSSRMLEKNAETEPANRFRVHIKGAANSELSTQGVFQLMPLKLQGELNIHELPLPQYWQAVDTLFNVTLEQGKLNFKGQYAVSVPEKAAPQWHLDKGSFSLAEIKIRDKRNQQAILSLNALVLDDIQASSQTRAVSITALRSHSAILALSHSKQGIDLVELFSPIGAQANTASAQQNLTDEHTSDIQIAETSAEITSEESGKINLETSAQTSAEENTKTPVATSVNTASNATSSEPQWSVTLKSSQLKDYQVNLTEMSVSETATLWQFSDIAITSSAIDTGLSQPLDYQVSMTINDGSVFESQGQLNLNAPSLDSQIALSNLKLVRLQPYVAPFIDLTIEDGTFGTQGQLKVTKQGIIDYQGQAQLASLAIKDNLINQPLINWQTMAVRGIKFNSGDNQLEIADISFDALFARLIIAEDKRTNISQLIKHQPTNETVATTVNVKGSNTVKNVSKEAVLTTLDKLENRIEANIHTGATSGTKTKPLSFEIKRIAFDKSSAFFADNSLNPSFSSGIEELTGEIINLSTKTDSRATILLNGKIDKYAPVVLKGAVNPFVDKPFLDIDLSFKQVELTSVNPYSGTYAGYYVDKGKLSLDLNYQLKNNQLQGKNHLVIEQLKLGKPSNSKLATSLPITLAIALLQDRHGVIDLGLEVTGDVNSPSFSFGSIIFAAMGNLITKAVTSPFTLLANLIGANEDELDIISFDYGTFDINKDERRSLRKLAKALNDRPLLTIELRGSIDQANDRQALAEAMLHQQLARIAGLAINELPTSLSASQFPTDGPLLDALMSYLTSELKLEPDAVKKALLHEKPELNSDEIRTHWHIALYNLAKKQQKIDSQALSQLALARSEAVKSYLVEKGKVNPARVFLLDSKMTIKQQHSAQVLVNLDASKA
ncbi:DUF748 domain-containing protein [Shewanella sp. SR44-3]|uniref:DUF748 domain-containing protein n=2 Tax=unclassified Shewanella TaxID=196818 RepID=UPI0015F7B84D|nr:DUF748 domain-containing protein [Shewanella sp. SR44-3]MBB1267993.1 DUF748 domain-containing protein [Shewanella sp. SR44-3]